MSRTSLPTPKQPDERGSHAGRDYWLWLPGSQPPWPAMVIVHGAGSAKENHADFGRLCAAAGWVALSYDQRGHGEGTEPMAPAALADVGRMARLLAERPEVDPRRVCVRGSSMGGFLAIQAAASSDALAGVIAICPASAEGRRRGLRSGELQMRADVDSLDAWLAEHDLADAVTGLAGKPLILLHARGDDRVPHTHSETLFAAASEPRKLIVVPGGNHHSVQHDSELQGVSLRWLGRALQGR
jgi:dienelactone hydrolase